MNFVEIDSECEIINRIVNSFPTYVFVDDSTTPESILVKNQQSLRPEKALVCIQKRQDILQFC